jgi:hypothetical protein
MARDMAKMNFSLIGFMAMAFAVVGMVGVFATYAAPLPLERALAREAALDAALEAAHGPNAEAALAALRPKLGDGAAVLAGDPAGLAARIARERPAMRAHFIAEAAEAGFNIRLIVVVITVMGAVFGSVLLSGATRRS